jgi:hypothetical protein
MELRSFLTQLLSRHDCLVEEAGDAGLRVLFPSNIQESLHVGELEIFNLPRGDGKSLSLVHGGRDFIEALEPLAFSSGLFSAVAFPRLTFPVKEPEGLLASHLTIQNGVFRLKGVQSGTCSYLVVHFRIVATADTRSERLVAVTVNEQTRTIPVGMEAQLPYLFEQWGIDGQAGAGSFKTTVITDLIPCQTTGELAASSNELGFSGNPEAAANLHLTLPAVREQAMIAAREIFRDFINNLNRRLERDLTRLQQYYLTLAGEIEKRHQKKGQDPEERERAISRLEATKADYFKKIQDARDKYALEIVIEPVSALRVELPVTIMEVVLQRRKESRLVSIAVNPVIRRMESLVCEKCRGPVLNFHLCDALHILCPICFPDCPACNNKQA